MEALFGFICLAQAEMVAAGRGMAEHLWQRLGFVLRHNSAPCPNSCLNFSAAPL